jgi:pectinesterase
VTNSGVQNRLQDNRQTRTLVTNSYIEGDVDIVSGRGAVVFDNTDFRVVNSRTQKEAYVFAPATLKSVTYGFLATNSRFTASGDNVAQLGRALDVDGNSNGQVVIRDSVINEGFNIAQPWAAAVQTVRSAATPAARMTKAICSATSTTIASTACGNITTAAWEARGRRAETVKRNKREP